MKGTEVNAIGNEIEDKSWLVTGKRNAGVEGVGGGGG